MLDPRTWLEAAQSLPLDGQQRVRHECGQGKVMVVYHKDEGWSAYCHRCGEPGFVARPRESLAERLARIKARDDMEAVARRSIVPPMPAVTNVTKWPALARVWLYKAGFSNDDIYKLGIYYHAELDRVVIPIVSEGTLTYWQARAYDWRIGDPRPKYLNPSSDGARQGAHMRPAIPLFYLPAGVDSGTLPEAQGELRRGGMVAGTEASTGFSSASSEATAQHAEADGTTSTHRERSSMDAQGVSEAGAVALVEDYLSAYRVSRAGIYTITLLGTKLGAPVLAWLMQHKPVVYVWLDNDTGRRTNPGQEAAATICKQLRQLGLTVHNVVSDRDPKQHSRKEIVCRLTQLY